MNKIIKSLSVIAFVAAIAIGGTMAYFSDTEKSTGNTFTAGTLDLKTNDADGTTGTFNVLNMIPGDSETTGTVKLKNMGTVNADHVRITSVVNTPSDNGINEPECKAYNGEWKSGFNHGWCCVIPSYDSVTCANVGGTWGNTGSAEQCYAEDANGFKDGWNTRNDIDKYLQVTSIKYADQELSFMGHWVVNPLNTNFTEVDVNRNGYLDLDDLETVAATEGSWLDNLTPGIGAGAYHTFQMTVKLHEDAGNVYQTDKDEMEITFQLNQDSSQ